MNKLLHFVVFLNSNQLLIAIENASMHIKLYLSFENVSRAIKPIKEPLAEYFPSLY